MSDWRQPTAEERELLRVILLADVPERETLQGWLAGRRVRTSCTCGCGSLEFESDLPEGFPGHWEFELEALTRSGARATVALRRRGRGEPALLEITRLGDSAPVIEVAPESLRQSDVVRVERGVRYYALRKLTVIEEAAQRGTE